MTLLEKTNLIIGALTVMGGSICGLVAMLTRIIHLVQELRHELNSRIDEMQVQSHAIGKLEGAGEERERSRQIAKDLIRDTAAQGKPTAPLEPIDDL